MNERWWTGARAVYGAPPSPDRWRSGLDELAPQPRPDDAQAAQLRGADWLRTRCALCGRKLAPVRAEYQLHNTVDPIDDAQSCSCNGEETTIK